MKTICLINHKGGVAKTTSVMNIAAGLALKNKNVLMVDMDAQANLTESFGQFNVQENIYTSFSEEKPLPVIPIKKNLSIVPSNLDFASIELEIASAMAREKILLEKIKKLNGQYDYIIIDCPPSLGLITINALVASNDVYIPILAEYLPYRGVNSIVNIIMKVKQHFNPELNIKGVFFTKYEEQILLSKSVTSELKNIFGDRLMKTSIRKNISLAECQANGKDIFEYDSKCNGASDYMNLINEILKNK